MVIGHFQGLWEKSGVATLLHALIDKQRDLGHTVHYLDYEASLPFVKYNNFQEEYTVVKDDADLFVVARALQLDILHTHHPIGILSRDRIPVVRTVHNQGPHCPSTLRYLKRRKHVCSRTYNMMGCLWGHAVEGCGRARDPRKWKDDFEKTWKDQRILPLIHSMAVSRFVRDEMVRAGYPEDLIDVVPIAVPGVIPPYTAPPDTATPHFVFFGRIVPEKGLRWLLNAAARLDVPFHLDIAGEGPQMEKMRRYAAHVGITDCITFHGWVNAAQREALLASARAIVIPSTCQEASGVIAVEAAAAGRAMIASNVGGLPEYAVHRENALIVEPEDTEALARAIHRLVIDGNLAQRLGHQGYIMARNCFTLDRYYNDTMEVYLRAINESTSHPAEEMLLA